MKLFFSMGILTFGLMVGHQSYANVSGIDEVLLCQNWDSKKMTQISFLEQLAMGEIESAKFKKLELELKKKYTEQKMPNKDDEGDAPFERRFIPKNKSLSIFGRIDTASFYGYGNRYQATFNVGVNVNDIKSQIEQRDKVKFSSFNAEQIRQYRSQREKVSNKVLKTKYQGLYLLDDEKQYKQAYIASKPRVVEDGYVHFVDYVHITVNNRGVTTLECGSAESQY